MGLMILILYSNEFFQIPYDKTGDNVQCNLDKGLRCIGADGGGRACSDYKVSVGCLKDIPFCGKFCPSFLLAVYEKCNNTTISYKQ